MCNRGARGQKEVNFLNKNANKSDCQPISIKYREPVGFTFLNIPIFCKWFKIKEFYNLMHGISVIYK